MADPIPFLWTILPMTSVVCKAGEHDLALPMLPSQTWMH